MISYSGNEKEIINELFIISQSYKIVVDDFEKQQYKINSFFDLKKHFLKKSFLKSIDLVIAIIKLIGYGKPCPNEALILCRSLLEHSIDFGFIFSDENEKQHKYWIERFKDYFENVLPYKTAYKIYNDNSLTISDKEIIKKELEEYDAFRKIDIYFSKYGKNINSWANFGFKDKCRKFLGFTRDQTYLHWCFLEKLYNYASEWSHCTITHIPNRNEYTNKCSDKTTIEALYILNFLYTGYIEMFYNVSDLENQYVKENYFTKFSEIEDKYDLRF